MDTDKKLLKNCYTKSARAITGRVVKTENETEVKCILQIIAESAGCELSGDELYELAKPYINDNEQIYGLSCCTVYGDDCINLILREKNKLFNICSKNGVYCYVLNMTAPHCSELGLCVFEETKNGYHRVI